MSRRSSALFALLAAACSNADGTRGQCAEGGELNACPEAERTVEGACWRLVDCGAIPLDAGSDNIYRFDWNRCVGELEQRTTDRQRVVIDCIAAASCDALQPNNPQDPDPASISCLVVGGID